MNWFVVPPLGGLEIRSSTDDRLKAGLRTASQLIDTSTPYFSLDLAPFYTGVIDWAIPHRATKHSD